MHWRQERYASRSRATDHHGDFRHDLSDDESDT